MAVFRRSGDEIHPWLSNGDLRPLLVSCDPIAERPLRKQKLSFRYSYLYSYCRPNVDVDKPNRLRSASVTGHADGA